MAFSNSLALAFMLVAAVQGATLPIVANCKQRDEYWKSGSVYRYSYTAAVKSSSYKSDGVTGTEIKCDVDLTAFGQCAYLLTTSHCGLSTLSSSNKFEPHSNSAGFNEQLSKNPVAFHMSNGEVHDVIVSDDEPTSIVNIKRGIISSLQGGKFKYDFKTKRADVHGVCQTRYVPSPKKLHIVKDLDKCHYPSRPDWELSPASIFWNASFAQSWITHASSDCYHKYTDSALESSECEEIHKLNTDVQSLVPKTVVTVKLLLKDTQDEKRQFDRNLRGKHMSGIQYEWEEKLSPTETPENNKENVYALVNEMVSSTREEIRPTTIPLFDRLVLLLRLTPDVTELTQGVVNCDFTSACDELDKELSRAYIRDALFTCNSEACVKALSWLATHDHLSTNYVRSLLLSWTRNKVRKLGYVEAIYDICYAKPTRTCYLSLTSVIHSYAQNRLVQSSDIPNVIKKTVQLLATLIPRDCIVRTEVDEDEIAEQRRDVEQLILAIKSIGNLGDIAFKTDNSLLDVINSCINNHVNPHNISVEAIKSLRRVSIQSPKVYDILMKMIRNQDNSMEKRIISYLVLTRYHHGGQMYDDLAEIIKHEHSDHLGNFITMHMNNIVLYGDSAFEKLKISVRNAFKKYGKVFVVSGSRPYASSRYVQKAENVDSADAFEIFGYDVSTSTIYETSSFLPQHVITNLTTQLLGKTFNTATISAALHGLEPYLELFMGPKLGKLNTLQERYNLLQARGFNLYELFRSSDYTPHYDDDIEKRLDEIHKSVNHGYAKDLPAGSLSIKRHGNEVAYTSIGLLRDKISRFLEDEISHFEWHEKHSFSDHRLVRFIESYNQYPLLCGLPLKWKFSVTTALSLRLTGKADPFSFIAEPPAFDSEWDIETSGALSSWNKMKVSVPKFTIFGVQANMTLYRSRERAGALKYNGKELDLVIKVPQRPQELFSFYRTEYLYRDGALESNTVPGVRDEKCLSDQYSGLKLCRYIYHGKVDGSNPLQLLSSNLEYRLWYELADKGLREYKLLLRNLSPDDGSAKRYTFSFSAPGNNWQRKVEGRYERNLKTDEFDVQLSVPEKPHFKFQGSRKRKDNGYATDFVIQLVEGKPLQLHAEASKTPTKSEATLTVQLSDRSSTWRRVFKTDHGDFEIDHYLIYESSNPKTYLHQILPDVFWESNSKATLHLHISAEKKLLPGGFIRTSDSYIKLPKTILELKTNRIADGEAHNAGHLNLTRRHLPSEEIESLIYGYFDSTNTVSGGKTTQHHVLRLLIPHVRWTLKFDRELEEAERQSLIVLKREKATDGTVDVTDSTPVDKWDVSFKLNYHDVSKARGDKYPAPREEQVEAVFQYPRDGTQHSLSYKGTIIRDEAQKNAITSFQTDSHIESSYLQLKLHGKSNYIRTTEFVKLDHHSDINNLATGNTATYDLHLNYDYKLPFDFNQSYKSKRLTFKETFNIRKDHGKVVGDMEINSACPEWDFLDLSLKQNFEMGPKESKETMAFRHKYLDIDVKGLYKMPLFSDYKKEFDIRSKNSVIPSMKIDIHCYDNRYFSSHVKNIDNDRNVYSLLEIDPSGKNIVYNVSYDQKGSAKKQVIDWQLHIVKSDLIIFNYTTDHNAIRAVINEYAERFAKLIEAWNRIKEDYDHPMNKYLRPLVKTTLGDFERELAKRIVQKRENIANALREAKESLKPLVAPAAGVVKNILALADKERQTASSDDSAVDELLERYRLRQKIRQYFEQLVERIVSRLDAVVTKSQTGSTAVEHPLDWESFHNVPKTTPKLRRLLYRVPSAYKTYKSDVLASTREAVLFAGRHVYTFDGRYYKLAGFANDQCTFLLAHNFVTRQFSLLVQKGKLHLLLPDLAINVDVSGKVTLNKEQKAAPLPIIKDHVTVTRVAQTVSIGTEYGIDLNINTADRVVLISISPWLHNKTLGLLGNNDNQVKNDFKLSDGKMTDNVQELLAAYELTGNPDCSDPSKIAQHEKSPGDCHSSTESCKKYLDEKQTDSPLYLCFDVVDPTPFYQACESDLACDRKTLCSITAAYSALCANRGIPLSRPGSCTHG